MSAIPSTSLKGFRIRRRLVIGLLVILVLAVTTGFVLIQADHSIAPPGLRMQSWLWSVFVR